MSAPARPSLRRIAAEIRPHRWLAARGALALLAGTLPTLAGPALFGLAIDRGVVGGDGWWIAGPALALAAGSVVQAVAMSYEVQWMSRFAHGYLRDLRTELIDHLFSLDLDFFSRERSGRLVSRLTSDVETLQQFFENGVSVLLRASLVLGVTLVVLFVQSVPLSFAVAGVLVPLVAANGRYRRRAFEAQLEVRDRVATLLTHLNESLIGIRVVQAFTLERAQRATFRGVNTDTYAARMRTARVQLTYYPLVELLHPIALAVVVGFGAHLVTTGSIGIGTVVAFMLYVGRLFEPIQQLTELSHVLQAASASFAKVFEFRDERPRVTDVPGATAFVPGPGEVVLEGVSFRYSPSEPDVLHEVDLRIAPGERVALVGGSGAGKSTVAKLMARFYDPTAGRIVVDGQDVRSVQAATLRQHLTLVPQEGFLFDGSVVDNIALARPGAGRAEVIAVCDQLGITERLLALPQGLDTMVANRGASMSSGQRQLVALARALLAAPRVLLLDEATSNLDPASEVAVEQAMQLLLADRTAVVIAHRLTSALRADRVVLIEDGRIAEEGPPLALLAAGGTFARWVASASALGTWPAN